MSHSLFIKSMVCTRCKLMVTQLFNDFNITPLDVQLGEVILDRELTKEEILPIQKRLEQFGFELVYDNRARIAMKIKTLMIELIESGTFDMKLKMSEYISEKLSYEYHYMSNLFSDIEGTTIEKYFIVLKIEKVKELIEYGQHTLSEISYKLGYSSPAHLTNQFKSIAGITPSYYKSLNKINRKPLDKL